MIPNTGLIPKYDAVRAGPRSRSALRKQNVIRPPNPIIPIRTALTA